MHNLMVITKKTFYFIISSLWIKLSAMRLKCKGRSLKFNKTTLTGLLYLIKKRKEGDNGYSNPVSIYTMELSKYTLENKLLALLQGKDIHIDEDTSLAIFKELNYFINCLMCSILTTNELVSDVVLGKIHYLLTHETAIYKLLCKLGLSKEEIYLFYMYSELTILLLVSYSTGSKSVKVINDTLKIYKEVVRICTL